MAPKVEEQMIPLYDRIVIRRVEEEERTQGGLYIPGAAREKPQRGEVIAVGVGRLLDDGTLKAPVVKVGDIALFGKYTGAEFELNGEKLLTMREDDVLGLLVKPPKAD